MFMSTTILIQRLRQQQTAKMFWCANEGHGGRDGRKAPGPPVEERFARRGQRRAGRYKSREGAIWAPARRKRHQARTKITRDGCPARCPDARVRDVDGISSHIPSAVCYILYYRHLRRPITDGWMDGCARPAVALDPQLLEREVRCLQALVSRAPAAPAGRPKPGRGKGKGKASPSASAGGH